MKLNAMLAISTTLTLLAGCVAPTDSIDEDMEPALEEQALLGGGTTVGGGGAQLPPAPIETPTTLTFYAGQNLTGASYTVSLTAGGGNEATQIIRASTLAANGLKGQVSSVRLACGTRPSRATLFDIDWGQFSEGTLLDCDVNQVVSTNLTGTLDNQMSAAALVLHAQSTDNRPHGFPFSYLFGNKWREQMQSLPYGATPSGTAIWLESWKAFRVHQTLTLDSVFCSARVSDFDLRVQVSTVAFQPVFSVSVVEEYVPPGMGDAWGCRTEMQAKLHQGALDAKAKLEAGLPDIFLLLGSQPTTPPKPLSSATHYFAPTVDTTTFEAFMRL